MEELVVLLELTLKGLKANWNKYDNIVAACSQSGGKALRLQGNLLQGFRLINNKAYLYGERVVNSQHELERVKIEIAFCKEGSIEYKLWNDKSGKIFEWNYNKKLILDDLEESTIEKEKISNLEGKKMYSKARDILDILKNHNPQIILQGPPGSGKTYLAEEVIKHIANTKDIDRFRISQLKKTIENIERFPVIWDVVQFHPSYSYEDFVRGLVTEATDSGIIFKAQNRILGEAAVLAQRYADIPVFLILDEINRADLSRVLGELIYVLERDRRGSPVSSQYAAGDPPDRTLILPKNLYLIGTMNTADRSIALVDYAIRRRFSFFSILPSIETVENFYKTSAFYNGEEKIAQKLGPKVTELYTCIYNLFNNEKDTDDIRIGHSYFLVKGEKNGEKLTLEEWADTIAFRFAYEVIPMIAEYKKERRLGRTTDKFELKNGIFFSLDLSQQSNTRVFVRNWLVEE